MSILLMIFVNNGAGGYQFLEHATWNGLQLGDLVFPCFMWIMGVCMPLSISSQLSHGISTFNLCSAIVKVIRLSFFFFFFFFWTGKKKKRKLYILYLTVYNVYYPFFLYILQERVLSFSRLFVFIYNLIFFLSIFLDFLQYTG